MVLFVVALPAEAHPLIDHYGLKLISRTKPFKIFEGRGKRLILSGVGKIKSADAASFLHAFSGSIQNQIWLNIGIAGHSSRALGEGILAHKITDQAASKSWYPPIVMDSPCPTEAVLTVDQPQTKYDESCAYDMEAASFYEAARRFSTVELVQCYKVISDNHEFSSKNVSSTLVERLMGKNLKMIDEVVQKTEKLAQKLPNFEIPKNDLQKFLEHWHFTVTEQHQLRRLLLRLKALEPKGEIWPEVQKLAKSKNVLEVLKGRINSLPVEL